MDTGSALVDPIVKAYDQEGKEIGSYKAFCDTSGTFCTVPPGLATDLGTAYKIHERDFSLQGDSDRGFMLVAAVSAVSGYAMALGFGISIFVVGLLWFTVSRWGAGSRPLTRSQTADYRR